MGNSVNPRIEVAVSTNLECAHRDPDGRIHGHSYMVEVWTPAGADLPALAAQVHALASGVDHTMLKDSIGSPRMEGVAAWFLARVPGATRVIVRRPTLGFAAEARSEPSQDR
jgi:6-pyruvoyl-tetrahydropterin synthase